MEIYVLSAGVSQQQDYIWQHITYTEQKPVDEPFLVKKFKTLLETEAFSIFIGRESNKLILLVTGMKASNRKDYRGRTIRNSIALIAQDNPENEQKIRGIAVLALKGNLENELENKIDSAITSGGTSGFEVDYQKIDNIIKAFSQTKNVTATKHVMTGKNTENNRNIVAGELQQYCLPQKTNASEALVVVTGIKTEDTLKKAGVWRGLSNLVDKEKLAMYKPLNSTQKFFTPQDRSRNTNTLLVITLIIFLGVIGLIALYFLRNPTKYIIGQNHSQPTTVVLAAITPVGEYFATTNLDGQLLVQNTQGTINNTIENNAPVKSVAISSDGNYVVTGDDTGNVQLWDVNNKKNLEIIGDNNVNSRHEKAVLSVDINAYQNQIKIVSGDADGKVLLWNIDVKDGKGEASIEKLSQ